MTWGPPELLTVHADEVDPLDVVDEGRFVRSVTLAVDLMMVSIEVAPLCVGTEVVVTAAGDQTLRLPVWGDSEVLVYKAEETLTVVRGMAPPPQTTTPPAEAEGVSVP